MEQDEFISLVREMLRINGGFYIGDLFPSAKFLQNITGRRPKLEMLHQKVDRILEKIINDHKETESTTTEGLVEGEEDLIDVLLKFEEGGSNDLDFCLTKRNIKAIILVSIITLFQNDMLLTNYASMFKHFINGLCYLLVCLDKLI